MTFVEPFILGIVIVAHLTVIANCIELVKLYRFIRKDKRDRQRDTFDLLIYHTIIYKITNNHSLITLEIYLNSDSEIHYDCTGCWNSDKLFCIICVLDICSFDFTSTTK